MAELLIRASSQDAAVLRRVYGLDGRPAAAARPSRIVIDAHVPVASRGSDVVATARRAGVPLLIDPQTFYLQGTQHARDRWACLPFGRPGKLLPADVDGFVQEELVAEAISYQISHGATAVIPPISTSTDSTASGSMCRRGCGIAPADISIERASHCR
jgi:hypothetical protein